jgi:hypothetical protein
MGNSNPASYKDVKKLKFYPMPEISRFYGIVVRMFYNDHNPPHIHIEYQDYDATIDLEDGIVKGEMPRRALKLIYEWIDLHKEELFEDPATPHTAKTCSNGIIQPDFTNHLLASVDRFQLNSMLT